MFREKDMVKALDWLLGLFDDEDYECCDDDEAVSADSLCLHDVAQALRDKAENVYQYKVDCNYSMGFKYRGKPLFTESAILIYKENESATMDNNSEIWYDTELWLMEEGNFAVVHSVRMKHDDGVIYETEYRSLVGIVEEADDLFFFPEELICKLDEACVPVWEHEATIYEM
ncbi:hypothetical protein [Eisenbergiella massiliensis]|uniref:hypothetical protein n=1 Tax=Eisenbergiella massiliensis TaxID=1720294 RepID=UPI0023F2EF64|nr:hypothetical protein [Eisenbergiella massiliensis]